MTDHDAIVTPEMINNTFLFSLISSYAAVGHVFYLLYFL